MSEVNNHFIEQAAMPLKKTVLIVIIALVIWQLMDWAKKPSTLPIKHVRIEGAFKYVVRDEISKILTPIMQTGYFAMEAGAVVEEITALEWVKEAKVRRVWPDEVVLYFTEQEPVAIWNEVALLNKEGEIFRPDFANQQLNIPYLKGIDSKSITVLKKQKQIEASLMGLNVLIERMELAEHGSWSVVTNNGVTFKVGHELPEGKIKKSLMALASIDESLLEHVRKIDLRYPNGMAVTWLDGYVLGEPNANKKSLEQKEIQPFKG